MDCRKIIFNCVYALYIWIVSYTCEFSNFFFFLISMKDVYSKNCFMQRSTNHIKDYKKERKAKWIRETNYKEKES